MKKDSYNITVLLDLNDSKGAILDSAVALAKIIGGKIEVFHVKKPSDIVEYENQLSAMRTINSEHTRTDKKIRKLLGPIERDSGAQIKYSFAFGNVKNEIGNYLEEQRPDVVVLGKRKSNPIRFIGDGVTEFTLNTFNGPVMIATDKKPLVLNREFSLGILNSTQAPDNLGFAKDLILHARKPLKSFNFIKTANKKSGIDEQKNKKTIAYIFEHNDSTVKNLKKYLLKNHIDLLLIDRKKPKSNESEQWVPNYKGFIGNLDVAVLLSGN